MKSVLVLFLVLKLSFCLSQNQGVGNKFEVIDPSRTGKIFRNPIKEATKIEGSPYLIANYRNVKVDSVNQEAKMRYNVFIDEFEFITPKNDTLILDKIDDFKNLNFVATNTKYKLVNYLNVNDKFQFGYLIDLYQKNDFGLLKKENIQLTEEKTAKTSLEQSMPAKYFRSSDIYFFKNKDKISEFPSNKKRLSKIFPAKKEAIETFVKENKIDFDKEADKIKIIDFLSTM